MLPLDRERGKNDDKTYRRASTPVEAVPVPVDAPCIATIEVFDLELPLADDVVVGRHHARHGRQKHAVAGHDGEKGAPADVDVARKERGQVDAAGQGVAGDAAAELRHAQGEAGEEDGGPGPGAGVPFEQPLKQRRRVPDGLAPEPVLRCRHHQDAEHRGADGVDGVRKHLPPDGVSRLLGEAGKVALVEDAGRDGAHGGHGAVDHQPGRAPGPARRRGRLRPGRAGERLAEAVAAHGRQRPDEQHDEKGQGDGAGDVEEALQPVRPDPDKGQAGDGEEHVADEASRRHARLGRDGVGDAGLIPGVPGEEHEVDALPADPGLEPVPIAISRETDVSVMVVPVSRRLTTLTMSRQLPSCR
ncbi:hypothetical protein G6O67_004594 [Ophiocordyceps sinensis]|uniref:Uncharacterized protein n=1 Tax=Ophiocordyceps sinensis TaxID=72228 RepID=A0A8H4PPR3_9HYPO|nr:hypothetical protein G6O67_004594 [Ophiocordyceps sinensis]